ncbi:MAG: cation-translocating P-type ATPase [Phycisphaerales bacterium]|nr:cation-translocating P-type ATPase [Phycisphaerales bacterium]
MKSSHMHELVAIAFLASFVSGKYFEAASVAFFMLVAMFIEDRTAVGARKSIESLIRLSPTHANLKTPDGMVRRDAKDLQPDDVVVVRPGDMIPCDGVIATGQSTVNQASITGESLPVDMAPGHEVFSGTINLTGVLEIKVTRTGRDTTLGKVQDLILQASESRPMVVKMLETYASYYSPVVLMGAGILFFFTKDMNRAISLLLIACPCAIILAGPTAMIAAISAASRLGVLIKNVTDLDIARRINAIVFDKTGTLTHGNLIVERLIPAHGVAPATCCAWQLRCRPTLIIQPPRL